jgi:AcrR family transcriptional regulator
MCLPVGCVISAAYCIPTGIDEQDRREDGDGTKERLHERLERTIEATRDNPSELLVEVAYAYVRFAQELPAFYKLMFSGILEHEQAFPDFIRVSKAGFRLLTDLVERCQAAGVLPGGPADLLAVSVWSLVHGFTSLLLERQISDAVLERCPLKELIRQTMMPVLHDA